MRTHARERCRPGTLPRPAAVCSLVFALVLASSAGPRAAADESSLTLYRDWTTYKAPAELPHDDVFAIEIAGDAAWVGTRGGLACLRDGQWRQWHKSDGLSAEWISAIAVDDTTRDVWIGTWGGGLLRYSAGRFGVFTQLNSGLAGDMVFALAFDGRRIWAATNGGVCCFDPSRDVWALFEAKRADAVQNAFTSLAFDGRYLWANAWCDSIRRLDVTQLVLEEVADSARLDVPPGSFGDLLPSFSMALGSSSVAWATPYGLCSVDRSPPGGLSRYNCKMLDAASSVRCMAVGADGMLWVGRSDGLMAADIRASAAILCRKTGDATLYRKEVPVESKHFATMPPNANIRCLAADKGSLWIGTDRGLVHATAPVAWPDIPSPGAPSKATTEATTHIPASQPVVATQATPSRAGLNDAPSVEIAVLGPIEQTIGLPGESNSTPRLSKRGDVLAVQLAMAQVNAAGGYRGQARFAAASSSAGYARYGWTTPEDEFYIFADRPGVIGLIGEIAPENRVACFVAWQSEVPTVNTTSRSRPYHELLNPWITRCPRNDYDTHQRLLDAAGLLAGGNRVMFVSTGDVEETSHLDMWRLAATRNACKIIAGITWRQDDAAAAEAFDAAIAEQPDILLTWCDAATSAQILRRANAAGWAGTFIGSDWIVSDEFTEAVGKTARRVVALHPSAERPSRTEFDRFIERYSRQSSPVKRLRPPTAAAIANYDATLLMLAAINEAGADRHAVRVALDKRSRPVVVQWKSNSWQPVEENRTGLTGGNPISAAGTAIAAPQNASAR